MKTGKVVFGTLAGLAAGAVAGVLLAPKKGSLIRKDIIEKGDGYIHLVKSKVIDLNNTLTQKFKRTKNDAKKIVDTEKAKLEKTQNEAKNATEKLKNDIAAEMRHSS